MSDKQQSPYEELSYYGLSLLSYLRDSHPELAVDRSFIAGRADRAAEAYSDAIRAGSTHTEAEAAASEELYRGLHFSPYNTLVHILWDEFASAIPEEAARAVALRLLTLPALRDVLAKYDLADDFAATPEYQLLYTELVGTVQILLEDGLQ
ncbi:DUF1896 family protein [Alistipes sp. Z76]|nr:DUF1896 family protein [Alistipes sp. Z76]NCE69869.1 DUF1896 family protein [Muribaculaceae bacterium M3]